MVRQSIGFDGISKSGEVWQIFQPVKIRNISNISTGQDEKYFKILRDGEKILNDLW